MEREALKLALEALEGLYISEFTMPNNPINIAITAIKEALAQPAQEPVAWVWKDMRGQDIVSLFEPRLNSVPLYTAPPQREWVGLTDEDKSELAKAQHSWEDLCLAVEAKLKERNHGT